MTNRLPRRGRPPKVEVGDAGGVTVSVYGAPQRYKLVTRGDKQFLRTAGENTYDAYARLVIFRELGI